MGTEGRYLKQERNSSALRRLHSRCWSMIQLPMKKRDAIVDEDVIGGPAGRRPRLPIALA